MVQSKNGGYMKTNDSPQPSPQGNYATPSQGAAVLPSKPRSTYATPQTPVAIPPSYSESQIDAQYQAVPVSNVAAPVMNAYAPQSAAQGQMQPGVPQPGMLQPQRMQTGMVMMPNGNGMMMTPAMQQQQQQQQQHMGVPAGQYRRTTTGSMVNMQPPGGPLQRGVSLQRGASLSMPSPQGQPRVYNPGTSGQSVQKAASMGGSVQVFNPKASGRRKGKAKGKGKATGAGAGSVDRSLSDLHLHGHDDPHHVEQKFGYSSGTKVDFFESDHANDSNMSDKFAGGQHYDFGHFDDD